MLRLLLKKIQNEAFMNSTNLSKTDYITQFIDRLSTEISRIKQNPTDYKSLFDRVSPTDIHAIYTWIITNRTILDNISFDNPIRLGASQDNYPFPITIQMTLGPKGIILHFDPNSKLARNKKSPSVLKKEPEVKSPNRPTKILGQGLQKTVRKAWWLEAEECYLFKDKPMTGLPLPYNAYIRSSKYLYYHHAASGKTNRLKLSPATLKAFDQALKIEEMPSSEKRKLTPSELTSISQLTKHVFPTSQIKETASSIVKDKKDLKYFNRGKRIYEKIKHNPFILPLHYGAIYQGHGKDRGKIKSAFYAPRATAELFDLLNDMDQFKPDLADILWITFSLAYALKITHESGVLLRDIKPENILILRNVNGICAYINDLDLGTQLEKASTKPEGGSPMYVAFDRWVIYGNVLEAHNTAISDLETFNMPQFSLEKCTNTLQMARFNQYKSILKSKSEKVKRDYIKWCCSHFTEQLQNRFIGQNLDIALNNLLTTYEPIPCNNTPNHPKDDVWSLAVVLHYLLEYFNYYDRQLLTPIVLADLRTLVSDTLRQQRAVRPDANELFIKVKKLIEENINRYAKGSKREQLIAEKFYKQLSFFEISLKEEKIHAPKTMIESISPLSKEEKTHPSKTMIASAPSLSKEEKTYPSKTVIALAPSLSKKSFFTPMELTPPLSKKSSFTFAEPTSPLSKKSFFTTIDMNTLESNASQTKKLLPPSPQHRSSLKYPPA